MATALMNNKDNLHSRRFVLVLLSAQVKRFHLTYAGIVCNFWGFKINVLTPLSGLFDIHFDEHM